MSSGLPVLNDLSLAGRVTFLDTWEPVLWAYWSNAFTDVLTSDQRWLRASDARAGGRDDIQAGQWIAQGILDALRTRPRLDFAPDWTNLPRWYAWWVGRRAVSAQRSASTFSSLDEEHTGADTCSSEDELVERLDRKRQMKKLLELIDRWADILGRISASTGLPDIEADWLWATCIARRRLAQLLLASGVGDERFQEVDKSHPPGEDLGTGRRSQRAHRAKPQGRGGGVPVQPRGVAAIAFGTHTRAPGLPGARPGRSRGAGLSRAACHGGGAPRFSGGAAPEPQVAGGAREAIGGVVGWGLPGGLEKGGDPAVAARVP